jgi:hypothetical protein
MRKSSYDSLKQTVTNLKNALNANDDLIIKSEDRSTFQTAVNFNTHITTLCKSVYAKFTDLKEDFDTNKINLARYKDHLKNINSLLLDGKKIKYSALHADEMAIELKKYF